jgi:hypothetical protein
MRLRDELLEQMQQWERAREGCREREMAWEVEREREREKERERESERELVWRGREGRGCG